MTETRRISVKNAVYQRFETLLANRVKRHRAGAFIVEGVRNINEAIHNGWKIDSFLYARDKKLSGWAEGLLRNVVTRVNYELTNALMEELSGKTDASELIAVVQMKDEAEEFFSGAPDPVIVLFDRPSNKGNLGTTIRSCDAFGAALLIITGHSVDVYDPDVILSSVRSFFSLPFARLPDNSRVENFIANLRRCHPAIKIIGTTARDEKNIFDIDLTSPTLFLIGNETDGLSRYFKNICDVLATIPMSETSAASSLNVSCAASVALYEAARQRSAARGERMVGKI